MKVLVVESCRSEDFYFQELDGPATYRLLRLLGHSAELKYALDRKYFRSAIAFATSRPFKVLHLSCHGDADGIQLSNLTEIGWDTFTGYFQDGIYCPDALVMSACQGASIGLAKSFAKREQRPKIIFGTTANRHYHDYAVAWAILYRRFRYGVHRDAKRSTGLNNSG